MPYSTARSSRPFLCVPAREEFSSGFSEGFAASFFLHSHSGHLFTTPLLAPIESPSVPDLLRVPLLRCRRSNRLSMSAKRRSFACPIIWHAHTQRAQVVIACPRTSLCKYYELPSPLLFSLFLSVQQIRSLAALYLSPSRLYTTICGGGRAVGALKPWLHGRIGSLVNVRMW